MKRLFGLLPALFLAAPAPAETEPHPYVIRGSCRLVVDGQTYVDIREGCLIWMAGDGTASGHWNGEPGATHAQSRLGEDFRLGRGGCWEGARATVCAAR